MNSRISQIAKKKVPEWTKYSFLITICWGFFFLFSACTNQNRTETNTIDLSGKWKCRLDPKDAGISQKWWDLDFEQALELPGSVQEQGFGYALSEVKEFTATSPGKEMYEQSPIYAPYREKENFRLSWTLNPSKYFLGPVWFKREIAIPSSFHKKHLRIFFERVHWFSDVWIDGEHIGNRNSLCVPHEYVIPPLPAGFHEITIRTDNRMLIPVGPNSQSITDHTQTNWNGIIGRMEIQMLNEIEIEQVDILPGKDKFSAFLKCRIRSWQVDRKEKNLVLACSLNAKGNKSGRRHPLIEIPFRLDMVEKTIEFTYLLDPSISCWDEFDPALYYFKLQVEDEQEIICETEETIGIRSLGITDKQFVINNHKIFLRGALENALYPNTGYPPMDIESWKKEIKIAKSYGLNHFRFHSWCPPEAAFIAADELGFYFQVEGPTWPSAVPVNPGTGIADFILLETNRILDEYGNHPSFVFFACGNEFWGDNGGRNYYPDSLLWYQAIPPSFVLDCEGAEFLSLWIPTMKEKSSGRQFFSSSSGWPYIDENDYHIMHEPYRMRYVFDKLPSSTNTDYSNLVRSHDKALVSHETGQWCAYPDFSVTSKFNGYLNAGNLEIFRDFAVHTGIIKYAEAFHKASGAFQAILYKEELENLFRTPGSAGFQLLGLQDYYGHGYAPVGIVDAFWEPKCYYSAEQFRQFCNEIVPLARMEKRVWKSSEIFSALIQVAQFSSESIRETGIRYKILTEEGNVLMNDMITRGNTGKINLPQGELSNVGLVRMDLGKINSASKLKLEVEVEATGNKNDWDFWVYPNTLNCDGWSSAERNEKLLENEIYSTRSMDQNTIEAIKRKKKILFVPDPHSVRATDPGKFETIFWSTATGNGTLGIHVRKDHPALRNFPTEEHANWQWWELLTTSVPLDLTGKASVDEPIVQVIDNWVRAHQLGLIFEFNIGESPVLVCATDIVSDLDNRIVARQLRYSLFEYMKSEAFQPKAELSAQEFMKILGNQ